MEAYSQKSLRTALLEVKGIAIYIFETKAHTSKSCTDILHKIHQGYTVQVNT